MVKYVTMKKVNIADVKTHLSALLDAASRGERVVICKRNQPVAELIPIGVRRAGPRPIGGAKGLLSVPPAFFEPLPDEVVDAFDAPAAPTPDRGASRVAGRRGRGRSRR